MAIDIDGCGLVLEVSIDAGVDHQASLSVNIKDLIAVAHAFAKVIAFHQFLLIGILVEAQLIEVEVKACGLLSKELVVIRHWVP